MNQAHILKLLAKFISIQSVSADSKRKDQMLKAVKFLETQLKELGFKVRILQKGQSPPLIIAIYYSRDDRPMSSKTIGIYGHYDVQPEDPVKEWITPPFKLTVKNGKLYGRGVADNKGHVIQNLTSIKRLIEVNKLNNNIVFILEGEEEVGSANFESYVEEAKDILSKVDVFYLTDVGMYKKNIPQIFFGLRGLVYFELVIETGRKDLHSGVWGNRVLNPALIAAQLISKMKDEKSGKILIPNFYNNVRSISGQERNLLERVSKKDEDQLRDAATYTLVSMDKRQPYLTSKIYPSLDVNGIVSGYIGEGAKTVIARSATIKFSCRLVEDQSPDKIEVLVKDFVKKNLPQGIKYELKIYSKDSPFYTDINNPTVKKTAEILSSYFREETRFNRTGGSIPAAEMLQRIYKKPIILTGFTLSDSSIHSPNENFDSDLFFKGIKALEKIYSQ